MYVYVSAPLCITNSNFFFFQGFDILPEGGIALISDVIREMLKIDCSVMMGANLAGEVAAGKFCESTIGNYCF